jgi:hypothetical protein
LLVGGPQVGKHALASAICGRAVAKGASPHAWRLDTKYYTADVLIDIRQLDSTPASAARGGGYEAAVLAFAAGSAASFASVQRWWEEAEADELPIRLVVATRGCDSPGAGEEEPAWVEAAREWCAERLIEWVEAGGAEGAAVGDGETTGAARVVEALHAHMWPGLQLKDAAAGPARDAPGGGGADAGDAGPAFRDVLEDDEAGLRALLVEDDPQLAVMERAFAEVSGERKELSGRSAPRCACRCSTDVLALLPPLFLQLCAKRCWCKATCPTRSGELPRPRRWSS